MDEKFELSTGETITFRSHLTSSGIIVSLHEKLPVEKRMQFSREIKKVRDIVHINN